MCVPYPDYCVMHLHFLGGVGGLVLFLHMQLSAPSCDSLSLSLFLLPRTLEFPGLLRDFRGVERSRASPSVAE